MSTQDIPDNELDDFFRKSLQEPKIDFREEDWLQMDEKLDVSIRRKAIFRRYLYSLLALLLITTASVLVWVNYTSPDEITQVVATDTNTKETHPVDSKRASTHKDILDKQVVEGLSTGGKGTAGSEVAESSVITQQTPATRKDVLSDKTRTEIATQEQNVKVTTSKRKQVSKEAELVERSSQEKSITTGPSALHTGELTAIEYSADRTGNIPADETTAGKAIRGKGKNNVSTGTATGKTEVVAGSKRTSKKTGAGNQPVVAESDEWTPTGKSIVETWADMEYTNTDITDARWTVLPLAQPSVQELYTSSQLLKEQTQELKNILPVVEKSNLPGDSTDVKRLAKERIHYRFNLSFVLSPDISIVRLSGLTKPGTNAGLLLGYQISRKLSINTGIIRSAKVYDARIEDYSPPPGQWTYYVKPVEIKASCTVLDIPLNIRYNFLMKQNYNLYATAGLSSYLMLSEKYRYIYDVDDTYLRKYWKVNNENKHYFKVYNLSAGYERKLGQRFSLGAEPFLKIPGAGVGFGKIHLWTAGLFVSANYKLGK